MTTISTPPPVSYLGGSEPPGVPNTRNGDGKALSVEGNFNSFAADFNQLEKLRGIALGTRATSLTEGIDFDIASLKERLDRISGSSTTEPLPSYGFTPPPEKAIEVFENLQNMYERNMYEKIQRINFG